MSNRDLAGLMARLGPKGPRARLSFLGELSLTRARVHEFCGPARRTLALIVAGAAHDERSRAGDDPGRDPILWLRPAWLPERLFPEGILPFINPGRLVLVTPCRPEDLLWCMEESLRCGAARLVVAELPQPPGLTPIRRLQLAAESGAAEGAVTPTGLILTPGAGGARGVESRWRLTPRHDRDHSRWRLDRLHDRSAPPRSWTLHQDHDTGALRLASAGHDARDAAESPAPGISSGAAQELATG